MYNPDTSNPSMDNIYNLYSPVVYGLAFQITSNEKDAEEILIACFQKIHKLKYLKQRSTGTTLQLIQLTIEIIFETFQKYKKKDLDINQFHKSPVLFQLIFEKNNISSLCAKYGVSTTQLMKSLRGEISALSNIKKRYLVRANNITA
jgi:hypothetical protein